MAANEQTTSSGTPVYMPGSKIPSTLSLAVAVILFFLPFAQIKCNESTLVKNSGFRIAVGKQWQLEENSTLGRFGQDLNNPDFGSTKRDPNVYALLAFGLAILALIFCVSDNRSAIKVAMASALLSAVSLICLWIDLRRDTHNSMNDRQTNDTFGLDKVSVKLEMTAWYYITILLLLAAAFFCFKRTKLLRR